MARSLLLRPTLLALGVAAFIGGCATLPADRGLSDVSALTAARGGPSLKAPDQDDAQVRTMIDSLLGRELKIQDALSIALVHNPSVRAEYARLGFAGADVLQAGRLSNPTLSVSVLFSNAAGAANQVGFGLAQRFTDLLLLPSRSRLAKGEFERTKAQVGGAVMALARDLESAYFTLIGAQQIATMRRTVAKSAQGSADLMQRFFDAGNMTDLELSLEKAAAAQAELNALSAQARADEARSTLNSLMGLPASETRWSVSDRLPLPTAQEDELPALQSLAAQQRLDLAAARQEVALSRDALSLTKTYRYLGNVDAGVQTERETDRSRITGPTLSLELPIFNQNQSGVLRAQSALELAEADYSRLENQVSNNVALAQAKVQTARRAVELHRQKLVPMRERVVQRTQEQVTYMLVGIFDLIRARQEEYDAYQSYLESVRDYWSARTELALAVGAQLPSSAQAGDETVGPEQPLPAPEISPMRGMQGMDGMKGMEGMDMKDKPGMDGMKGMGGKDSRKSMKGMPMKDKPAMKGMKSDQGMEGMDMKGKPGMNEMKGVDGMKGMEMKGKPGMEGMDHGAPAEADPAAVKAACDQIRNADMKDALNQALAIKCRALGGTAQPNDQHGDH